VKLVDKLDTMMVVKLVDKLDDLKAAKWVELKVVEMVETMVLKRADK